jgi:hypothetical protein
MGDLLESMVWREPKADNIVSLGVHRYIDTTHQLRIFFLLFYILYFFNDRELL